jgi:hypothetical protein
MKCKFALIIVSSALLYPLSLMAEPITPAKKKPDEKGKETTPKKEVTPKKEESKEELNSQEKLLADFKSGTPYNRELVKRLPSPFRDLVVLEKNRIKKELIEQQKKIELEKLNGTGGIPLESNDPNIKIDANALKFKLVDDARKSMETVNKLIDLRKYEDAETKLGLMDTILFKNNITDYRDTISKKKEEVIAEHKEWDEINKILTSLTVDAMFIAEGKKKVALINDIAVEEGDDLNELLSLSKDSPIVLTFVSGNSLKIKFKKFTVQKELVDNDL